MGKDYKIIGNLDAFYQDWIQRGIFIDMRKDRDKYANWFIEGQTKRLNEKYGNSEFKNLYEIDPPSKKDPPQKIEYYFSNN